MKEPDWKHWKNVAHVELLQAISLSVGLDPSYLLNPDHALPDELQAARDEIASRYHIALTHLDAGSLKLSFRDIGRRAFGEEDRIYVNLKAFRRWGEGLDEPLTFPDAYPRMKDATSDPPPRSDPTPLVEDENPVGVRERTNLLRIIRALDEMAKLPESGASISIEAQLEILGFDGPKKATIRKVISEARALLQKKR